MNFNNFLTEKGMDLLNAKIIIESMDETSANIMLKQLPSFVSTLILNKVSCEDFTIALIKNDKKYGSYQEYLKEHLDNKLASFDLKNYSISIDKNDNLYVEKVVRMNSNFIKNFFAIDIANAKQYDANKDFLTKFTEFKSKAILNQIINDLNSKINSKNITSSFENRKIVISFKIDKNDSEDVIVEKSKLFLSTTESIFDIHIDPQFKQ